MIDPLVSVIIPVYNVSPYVEECLKSVMDQTYKRLEVIIVDDCGTDDSMEKVERMLQDYAGEISFSILHHDRNRGLSAARNTGIDACHGDFISFIDSDDYVMPTLYETLVRAIQDEDDDVAILGCCCETEAIWPRFGSTATLGKGKTVIPPEDFAGAFLADRISNVVWAKLFRSSLFQDIRFVEGRNGEDTLLMFSLYPVIESKQYKTIFIPDRLYYYRARENSITTNKDRLFVLEAEANLRGILSSLKEVSHPCVKEVEFKYYQLLLKCIIAIAQNGDKKAFYTYCARLWRLPYRKARHIYADNFKAYLLMKYISPVYYRICRR